MSLLTVFLFLFGAGLFFVSAYEFTYMQYKPGALLQALSHKSAPAFWKLFSRCRKEDQVGLFYFYILSAKIFLQIAISLLFSTICFFLYCENTPHLLFNIRLLFILLLIFTYLLSDWIPRVWSALAQKSLEQTCKKPARFFLFLLLPIIFPLYSLANALFSRANLIHLYVGPSENPWENAEKKEEPWTEIDKRLVSSVLNFRGRIAREIMKPRVDLFCIPDTLSLHQAAMVMQKEGYSRVPVYKDTIDTITGILFYKDVLEKYVEASLEGKDTETLQTTPIHTLIKNVFYCPETKKISSLLQEFRKRKTHLAVIVDEYGGTSGLVTIEDILEEIVGEISDEYDEQETLYEKLASGGYIVDARMNLLDIEEEMQIRIPQEEDYDTLAGYIFYRVGSIPQAGLILHHDNFEIEITKSNDRMVEEVRITPILSQEESLKISSQESPYV